MLGPSGSPARFRARSVASSVDPSRTPIAIALVEDDERLRAALTRLLESSRFAVSAFASAEALLASTACHACLILDLHLPGLSGLELAERLREDGDRTPIVFMSGSGPDLIREVRQRTGRTCLAKPIDEATLLAAVATALIKG
jgi:FixJ family two-component response regulator